MTVQLQNKTVDVLKVFISVDMEGISGIVHQNETGGDRQAYELGRMLMIGDVNAAIDGVLTHGDAKVVVSDGHGSMRNLKPEELNAAADLVRGSPKPLTQMAGINREFNAALFIGYHSKKGTTNGILDHTISGRVIDCVTINGLEVGETALNAAIAGYYGVPLIFLSGDLAVTKEAHALIPNIKTLAVKEAISRTAAKCLNPTKARKLIKAGVISALKNRESIEPFVFTPPINVSIRYATSLMADAVEFLPFVERIDGRTISFISDDYLKAFGALRASIYIAGAVSTA
jgi:D-amino peptidase